MNVFLGEISCNLAASTQLANATWPDCLLDIHNLQELVLQVSNTFAFVSQANRCAVLLSTRPVIAYDILLLRYLHLPIST